MAMQFPGRHCGLALAVGLLGLAGALDAAAVERSGDPAPQWRPYRDRELGVSLDFPAHLFPAAPVQDKRRTVFASPDGRARISVFALPNEASETPRRYLRRIANFDGANFSYIRTTAGFFVASGTSGGMIFYRRCNFSQSADRRIGCVQLDYPQREKRAWDDTVSRVSRSLRTEGF
jgi:hypothetical protein